MLNQLLKDVGLNKEWLIVILLLLSAMNSRTIYNLWGTPVTDNPSEHKLEIFTIILLIIIVLVILTLSVWLIFEEFI